MYIQIIFFVIYQKYQDKYLLNSVTITIIINELDLAVANSVAAVAAKFSSSEVKSIINPPCFKIVLKPIGIIVFLTLYT